MQTYGRYLNILPSRFSGENAIGQLARLEDAIAELDHVPKRFQLYDREPWHSRGLRCMPVDHYRIFYIPNDEKFSVTVIRVMYDGRNADIQLKNNMID